MACLGPALSPTQRSRDMGQGVKEGERGDGMGPAGPAGNQPFLNAKTKIGLRA